MSYSIQEIASILGLTPDFFKPSYITCLLTDSRKLSDPAETLFFALTTKSNDAHQFVRELYEAGVRNFVVSRILPEWGEMGDANFLKVENPLAALQTITAFHRSKYTIPVIGITGSNGKTVVKEWLYQLLGPGFNIVRSPRSYNSQIGVPLSVWQLDAAAELGIFEAGISLPGEMERLEPIIRPTIGVLTNIGEAHQENFSSSRQKCMEKLGLFVHANGLIYDGDDELVSTCVNQMGLTDRAFFWSRENRDAHLYLSRIEKSGENTRINYAYHGVDHVIEIPFADEASIENAITCLAVALYFKVPCEEVAHRMQSLESVAMRLDLRQGKNGCLLINDSYNSDVNSIQIALDFQQQRKMNRPLKKTVILSDILQTGLSPRTLYGRVARMMEQRDVQRLIGIGPAIGGCSHLFTMREKSFYASTNSFIESGIWRTFKDELILLKGAREYHFERVGALLEERVHETLLEVNLDALVHNFNFYKSYLKPGVKLTCMVKANGYGAGAVEVAKTLQHHRCDALAVAIAEEGVQLRRAGISLPIIVLNPEAGGFEELFEYNLEPEVYNFRVLNAFAKEAERRAITAFPVHVKVDTGMHRLGFLPEEIPDLAQIIRSRKGLQVRSVFSHLAASESWAFDEFTNQQMEVFNEAANRLEKGLGTSLERHVLNSAGIERFPDSQHDMVRLGIGLYGVSASGLEGLRTVCSLKTTILQVKEVALNETVGYGRKEKLTSDARIATIRIGYADGLNRRFGNRVGKVLINGRLAPIVGSVCMDLCMVDVTGIEAQEGDTVVIFGEGLPVTEQAERIGTIPYEVLTSVSPRVKRVYIKE
ncbi:MAG: bifunctional UDP-N-acetylmuramoyl-tripeptide:D-alanyl-D-alanine ligase/alanine racemase [Bacteroidota bacterium]|jgi:alanine racemase|nr:bifunctional UDP-N-acetylmuramoyl-tripeptide:D-alanyl-D-alanine ligase/alanine racemase [Bacteroidota bacterium]HHU96886.1 bifunctional UDP-N-acetylmuramoyl-tripeptide:D-alanyl-D-alanine ligase/alanine racemase [Petrimonas sp.]